MKNFSRTKLFLASILLAALGCSAAACDQPATAVTEERIALIESKLENAVDRITNIENELELMKRERIAAENRIDLLRERLAELRGVPGGVAAPTAAEAGTPGPVAAGEAGAGDAAKEPAAEKPSFFDSLKEAIKKELKEDEKAILAEKRKKQAEQYATYVRKDFEKKMDGFGEFAEKIGLSGSQEADIRDIADETYKKVLAILTEAWSRPREEVNWPEVTEKMQEIYKEAEEHVARYVTEEQGEALKEYFGMNR